MNGMNGMNGMDGMDGAQSVQGISRRTVLGLGARSAGLVSLVSLAALSGGCGAGPGAEGDGEPRGSVLVYTSMAADIFNEIRTGFTARYPRVRIEPFTGSTEQIIARIETEREAGGIQADAIMVAHPSYYLRLKQRRDLVRYTSPEADSLPGDLKDAEGYFTAVRIISMVIIYNTRALSRDQAPQTWGDLLDPKWKGQIVMPNPLHAGTAYVTAGTLAKQYGWDYFAKLRANDLAVEAATQGVERRVASGEYKIGMLVDYSVRQGQARNSPVDLVVPKDGAVVLPSPIGLIAKRRSSLRAAQVFYDYLLSRDGQQAIAGGGMAPVRSDVRLPAGMPARDEVLRQSLPMDWQYLANKEQEIKCEFARRVLGERCQVA